MSSPELAESLQLIFNDARFVHSGATNCLLRGMGGEFCSRATTSITKSNSMWSVLVLVPVVAVVFYLFPTLFPLTDLGY